MRGDQGPATTPPGPPGGAGPPPPCALGCPRPAGGALLHPRATGHPGPRGGAPLPQRHRRRHQPDPAPPGPAERAGSPAAGRPLRRPAPLPRRRRQRHRLGRPAGAGRALGAPTAPAAGVAGGLRPGGVGPARQRRHGGETEGRRPEAEADGEPGDAGLHRARAALSDRSDGRPLRRAGRFHRRGGQHGHGTPAAGTGLAHGPPCADPGAAGAEPGQGAARCAPQ